MNQSKTVTSKESLNHLRLRECLRWRSRSRRRWRWRWRWSHSFSGDVIGDWSPCLPSPAAPPTRGAAQNAVQFSVRDRVSPSRITSRPDIAASTSAAERSSELSVVSGAPDSRLLSWKTAAADQVLSL